MQPVHPIAQLATNVLRGVTTKIQGPVHAMHVDLANMKSVLARIIHATNVQQGVTTVKLE